MKLRLLIAFIVVGMVSVSAGAQIKKLSGAQFNKAMDAAFAASDVKVRREVTKSDAYESGKVTQSATITHEFMPPDRERQVFDELFLGERRIEEWITVDQNRYEKNAQGEWLRAESIKTTPRATTVTSRDEEKLTIYTSQASKLAGKRVTILKRVYKSSPDEMQISETFVIYISKAGLVLKNEQTTVQVGKANYRKESTTFTYDPKNLKIEVPSLK